MKKNIFIGITIILFLLPSFVLARNRQDITDWYLKEFHSEIIVNKDSTLDISEKIIADCGNLPDKHGIFRILPTAYFLTGGKKVSMPLDNITVTDFSGQARHYQKISDSRNNSLTLKIGDPNRTVQGENDYLIRYRYKNAIRFNNSQFDELYWNLNGNFWEIETDKYTAEIILPAEINQNNTDINLYSGSSGQKDAILTDYHWDREKNSLIVESNRTLKKGEGITISIVFPKGIITPYRFTFWEKYGFYLNFIYLIIPPLVFAIIYFIWRKKGRDPQLNKTVIAEYEPPYGLSPLEAKMLLGSGRINSRAITATIVDLAIKGYLKIEETKKRNYTLILLNDDIESLKIGEREVIIAIFDLQRKGETKKVKDLINKFYKELPTIKKRSRDQMTKDGFFEADGFKYEKKLAWIYSLFLTAGLALLIFQGDFSLGLTILAASMIVSAIIFLVFSLIMPKTTPKGAEAAWRTKGFRLYMKTAERYRQEFYERENIFEKFLPYAIVFNIANLWAKKMKEIYGQEYFNSYHPIWFVGAASGDFNFENFNKSISQLTATMNASLSAGSSSGAGGGGFSGGGGGGGGGGGW